MVALKPAPRWRLRDGVLAQFALPQAVLLDARSGEYFELNAVGTAIVRALLESGTREAAIAALCAGFTVDAQRAGADVDAFAVELQQRGLLEAGDA
jgi:hypothetical protein